MRALLIVCAVTGVAHADGFYYEESFGVSSARGDAAPGLGTQMRVRLGLGVRAGDLIVEPWMAGDLTFDRDGATLGFGGTPKEGHGDLESIGLDVKYVAPVTDAVSLYVRGGPRVGNGGGALMNYSGPGVGAGAGVQIVGKVRALGFLWAPLFFVRKGPKVTGAIFLDQSVDVFRLYGERMTADAPVVSTNLGFAVGTDF